MKQKHKLDFNVLTDRGNQVASQFGLKFSLPEALQGVYGKFGIDLPRVNGEPSWTLPMPARFIVDRQSIVRSAAADPDYTVRPEPADTVKSLHGLASAARAT
jgi:peroxiredoxin